MNKKKMKHRYTSELELKSLLIRIKNERLDDIYSAKNNNKINKYIRYHTAINNLKKCDPIKKKRLKKKLKESIVTLSENTQIDYRSFEKFGEIILLMIKNILRKPQFSGYTYKDDFYSDSVHKILKYLNNYNHKLISVRTGLAVNAFAYISQIIHNSIVFIIKKKKKETTNHKEYMALEFMSKVGLKGYDWYINDDLVDPDEFNKKIDIQEVVKIKTIPSDLLSEVKKLSDHIDKSNYLTIYYPSDYRISFEEYDELSPLLKGKVSIVRSEDA